MNRTFFSILFLAAAAATCFHVACSPSPARTGPSLGSLAIRRGTLEDRFLLTGELRAVASRPVVIPRTPTWETAIQWIQEDGAQVKAGDAVAQLDNSPLLAKLEDQKLALAEAEKQLQLAAADAGIQHEQKALDVLHCRVQRDQARLDAGIPEPALSRREHQEKQLDLEKAEGALQKATRELESQEKSVAIKVRLATIARDVARRALDQAESSLESLTLRSPADGVLIVAPDYRYGRKWREGDAAYTGQVLAEIPDLGRMEVEAELSDVDDGQVAPASRARCRLDAYPDRIFPGQITWVGPVASERSMFSSRRIFRVKVALEKSEPEIMRPGMSVKVEVIRQRWEGALLAPRASLDLRGSEPLLLLADGRARKVTLVGCDQVECALGGSPPEGTALGRLP
jgi:HlyD family secretion protein